MHLPVAAKWWRNLMKASLLLAVTAATPHALAQDAVTVTSMTFRTGPFAAMGAPIMNGQRDYMTMLNERDGGVNGVEINYNECETGFNMEKGVECYEKTKTSSIVTQPWPTAVSLQLLPDSNAGKAPVLMPGYGFSALSEGSVFRWAFNPPTSYWDGASMILKGISQGRLDSLRGRKIVLLHLDAPYGREPIPLLRAYADRYGFTLLPVPVGVKEMQSQSSQWREIAREQPDFVLMWGWGAMNAGALAEAVKTGFPMDRFVGIWWSGNDADLKPLGQAAKGYRTLSWNFPESGSQTMRDIRKYVLDAGKSMLDPSEFDHVFYQRGVVISMIVAEALRNAQEHFEVRVVNGEQLRWGLANLKLDEARLAEIGMSGMVGPFATSCNNHTGHAGAWMLQWDGVKFVRVSELLEADQEMIGPLVKVEAKKYSEANVPWPIDEECRM